MPRIFLSHSSEDNREAIALKRWLVEQDPALDDDIFLDIDPRYGMVGGERWKLTLTRKLSSCEALLCLVSTSWESRPECVHEYRGAEDSGKRVFCARLDDEAGGHSVSAWQWRDVFVRDDESTVAVDIGDDMPAVVFSADGLDRLLRDVQSPDLGAGSFPWPPPNEPEREPYRGWLPFESFDAGVFFGRDTETVRALKTMSEIAESGTGKLFVVLGASGTGKSSFLRAGILPRLIQKRGHFAVLGTIRPGRGEAMTGDLGLASAIFQGRNRVGLTEPSLGEIKNHWIQDIAKVRELLAETLLQSHDVTAAHDPALVLPLDQAEELFSAEAGNEGPALLAVLRDLMAPNADGPPLRLIILATIRTDRYAVMQTAPQLAGVDIAFDELRPMPLGRFKEVIEGPAKRSTEGGRPLALEPALVNQLFADVANMTAGGDSLPLLSLTLHRMYRDYHPSGSLTLAQFTEMGGMASVVQNEIDRLLSQDPATRRKELELLKNAFVPWLATVSENNEPLRRIALWTDIPEPSREVVSRFVDARLLVRDRRALGTDGAERQDVVEVALESLLRQWPDLAQWLAEQQTDLKATDDLIREANRWEAHGRDTAYLYEGTLLTNAEALCASSTFSRKLESARDFVGASRLRESEREEETRRHAAAELQATRDRLEASREQQQITERHTAVLRRRDRILRSVLALTVIVALAAVAGFVWARHTQGVAERSARDATAQKLVAEAQSRLADAREGDDVQALNELLAANKLASVPNDRPLLNALVDRYSMRKVLTVDEPVIGVASAPRGHRLVMAEPAGIRVWDTSRAGWQNTIGDTAQVLPGGDTKLTGVAISPDGQTIAAGTEDGAVRVWESADDFAESRTVGGKHDGRITSLAMSSDGLIAAAGVDGNVTIWSSVARQSMPSIVGDSEIFAIAFDPSGHRLAVGRADGTLQVFDIVGPVAVEAKSRRDAHLGGVMSLAFSPDGKLLASGGADNRVRVWKPENIGPVEEMNGHTATVTDVAFNPDGTRIASGSNDKTVQMWDVASGERIGDPMRGHGGLVLSVDFAEDGSDIVSGGNEHTMRLWDATAGQPISTPISSGTGPATDVAISSDGREIVSVGVDRTVRVWNADTGTQIDSMSGHTGTVTSVALSPADGTVASASTDGTVRLWHRVAKEVRGTNDIQVLDAGRPLTSVAFSPTGNRLAVGGVDGQIVVWDLPSGQRRVFENKDRAIVYDVAFDPQHDRLASVSASGHLRMWRLQDGGQLWERTAADQLPDDVRAKEELADDMPGSLISVAFSPGGQRVATGGVNWTKAGGAVGFLQRFNVDDGATVGQPIKVGNAVMGIAFSRAPASASGDRIVVASFDPYEVQLWNTDKPNEAQFIFAGHQAQVVSVAISPDNRRIVSGSADGSLRIWPNLPTTPADEAICAKLTSSMTEKQWKAWISTEMPPQETCPNLSESVAAKPN